MDKRPHLLWLTPFPPSPPHDGGRKRMHVLLHGLISDYRITVLSYIQDPRQAFETRDLEAAGIRMHLVLRKPSAVPPALNLPGMAHPFYHPEMFRALENILEIDPPAAVQVEFFQMAPLGLAVPAHIPLFYTEHDASHLSRNHSYLPGKKDGEPPIEMARRRLLARRILRRASCTIAMSAWDAGRLRTLVPRASIKVIPMGVDCDFFRSPPTPEARIPGKVLFVGFYPHWPNAEAARTLALKIMPRIFSTQPRARLVLAGSDPTPDIQSLADKRISVPGTQKDLRPYFFSSEVFAAPVRLGYGMKTKLLEAFAAGLPVVALKPALRGIPAEHGRDVLAARNISEFSAQLQRLLRDPLLRRRLAASARRLSRRFDWSLAVHGYRNLYANI